MFSVGINTFIVKIQNIWNLIGQVCIFLIFLIGTVQISMECQTHKSQVGNTKIEFTLTKKKTNVRIFGRSTLIILNLYRISINKVLVTEFMTVQVSQNLNLMQKILAQ